MTTQPHPRVQNLPLRRARQEMRLSQAQFADAIRAAGNAIGQPNNCTKRLVQKWETGEHAGCRPAYLVVLQAVTGLSARELGFTAQPDSSGLSAAAPYSAQPTHMTSSSAVNVASPRFDEASETMDQLRRALNHPSTVDSCTAELVEVATARLFDLERHSPARLLAPTVSQHLATVTGLLTAARHESVRRKLLLAAGSGALLAGWLEFDRGNTASSLRFWTTAIGTAQGAGDEQLFAASLIYESYAAARRNDPCTAWRLAHTAARIAHDDLRVTAWANARVALHAAQLGERHEAGNAMNRSLEIGGELPEPKPGDAGQPWARFFSRAVLLASSAHTAALLNDPYAAEYAIQAVDAFSPDRVKARAIVLAEAALTAAHVGELKRCLEYGAAAAALTREMNVSIAADLLHEVVAVVLPYSDTRPVRELLPHLAVLPRTSDQAGANGGVTKEDAVA